MQHRCPVCEAHFSSEFNGVYYGLTCSKECARVLRLIEGRIPSAT